MSIKILCPVLLTLAALLSACSSDAEPPDAGRSVEEPLDRDVRVASDNAPAQPPAGEAAPAAPEVAIARPLVGPLRVVDKRFHDNTGPRRVFFTSAFPLLRVYHDDPARGDAIIDSIARAGYQGVRVFAYLGMYANDPDTPDRHEMTTTTARRSAWTWRRRRLCRSRRRCTREPPAALGRQSLARTRRGDRPALGGAGRCAARRRPR